MRITGGEFTRGQFTGGGGGFGHVGIHWRATYWGGGEVDLIGGNSPGGIDQGGIFLVASGRR